MIILGKLWEMSMLLQKVNNLAATWDFRQCGMCDQQRLRPACAYAQSDQSLCESLEYSMNVKLLTEYHKGVPNLNSRLHRLVWVYSCQNATLLEITCHSSTWFFSCQWCLLPASLDIYCTQIRTDGMRSLIWIRTLWHSVGVFWKRFLKK